MGCGIGLRGCVVVFFSRFFKYGDRKMDKMKDVDISRRWLKVVNYIFRIVKETNENCLYYDYLFVLITFWIVYKNVEHKK